MQQTLFFLPHWLFEGPLLVGWLLIGLAVLGWLFRTQGRGEALNFLPVYVLVAAIIHWVLPRVEVLGINPEDPLGPMIPAGLAIRGYGLFLLTAIVVGVSLAAVRSQVIGVLPERIVQLAFWMLISGIVGARLFYVIQKWETFFAPPWTFNTLVGIVDMTKGGLVVYGSLIGGMLGGGFYAWRNRLPIWQTADLIAPGMVIGLAIGRLGCLMNGCCFGGVCEPPYPAISFPPGSPPYMRQLVEGELIGIQGTLDPESEDEFNLTVNGVAAGSEADALGVKAGDRLRMTPPGSDYLRYWDQHRDDQLMQQLLMLVDSDRQGRMSVPMSSLPGRSARTQPTQIYSAINAALMCAVLWFFWTLPHRDGQVFALMLVMYPVYRFLMELIRDDERGLFGTGLTPSQLVSIGIILVGIALLGVTARHPRRLPQPLVAGN